MESGFYCTNLKQKIYKAIKPIFKWDYYIHDPEIARLILICIPVAFLWLSYRPSPKIQTNAQLISGHVVWCKHEQKHHVALFARDHLGGIPRYWFPKMHQDSPNWSSKLSWEYTTHHQWFKKYRGLFKIMLDLEGFTYVLTKIIYDYIRFTEIPPSCFFRFYAKQSRLNIVLDPPNSQSYFVAAPPPPGVHNF